MSDVVLLQPKERSSRRGRRRKSLQPKQEASPSPPPQDETGCLKCHKDIDYEQVCCTGRGHVCKSGFRLD